MSALKAGESTFINGYIDFICEREGSVANTASGAQPGMASRRSILVDVATAPTGLQIITQVGCCCWLRTSSRHRYTSSNSLSLHVAQLITSVTDEQRDLIIKTVRRNSVFLKGSKAGLKVHQLCGE